MGERVKLDGEIVIAAIRFTAHPGDRLVVVNGMCLGVQAANNSKPPPVAKAAATTLPTPTEETVLMAVREHQPIRAIRLADKMGIARSDAGCRAIVSDCLRKLTIKGQVRRTSASRMGEYVVTQ